MREINVLFEDPPIPSQKIALISIVGPHMPQKCDIWGLKIRGVAESMEDAKVKIKKLMKIDNDYDIYSVEVGKFFPLNVSPNQISEREYADEQLNTLIKSYLENQEAANEQWHTRKNEMVKEAIREGKAQEEMANKPEHPISVLKRIKDFENTINELKENINSIEHDLELSKSKFSKYTDEEREEANRAIESSIKPQIENPVPLSVDEIRQQLMSELSVSEPNPSSYNENDEIKNILNTISNLENEHKELKTYQSTINKVESPNVYKRWQQQIDDINVQINDLKKKLENKNLVNTYVNSQFNNSQYEYLNE
jgi:hypothetical protein